MNSELMISILKEGLQLLLILSSLVMVVPIVVGLIISIFQAATQIQEQSLAFTVKLAVTIVIIIVGFPYGMTMLVEYFQGVLNLIQHI